MIKVWYKSRPGRAHVPYYIQKPRSFVYGDFASHFKLAFDTHHMVCVPLPSP